MSAACTKGTNPIARLTGGQALVQSLKRHGVRAVFGLPGIQLYWIFDALYDERNVIKVYHTRHEQALSYMADGYARTTEHVGVCLMVPGPGLLNALAGLATAYACSSPVLALVGQIDSNRIGKGCGVLHEVSDQLEILRPVVKWADRAMRPEAIPGIVRNAFRQLLTGHARPVALEVPQDVLRTSAEVALTEPDTSERPEGEPGLVAEAAKLLGGARAPAIFSGGGVLRSGAWGPLQSLAEALEAPVVISSSGKGALSDRHYLAQSMVAARELLPRSDVVLIVGTRFLQPATFDPGFPI